MGISIRFQARGSSMHPIVRHGDVLWIEPINKTSLRVGEIAFFKDRSNHIIVHRVIRKLVTKDKGAFYLVQGDNLEKTDGWIRQEQILGRVYAINRNGLNVDMESPGMKLLSNLAVRRSLYSSYHRGTFPVSNHILKLIPVFHRYIS